MNERIPKIKKRQIKNNLQSVDVSNRDVQNLLREINKTCLDTEFQNEWEAVGVFMVHNSELEEKYIKKRLELKDEGRTATSLQDQLGFLVARPSCKTAIINSGLKATKQLHNRLGKGESGVYINRYFDIELKTCWKSGYVSKDIFVFKVYLYEYTDACEPAVYPRQCLPAAVIECRKRVVMPKPSNLILPKTDNQSGPTKSVPSKSANSPVVNRDKNPNGLQTAHQGSPLISSGLSSPIQKLVKSNSDLNQNITSGQLKSSSPMQPSDLLSTSHVNKSGPGVGLLNEKNLVKRVDKRSTGSMDSLLQQTPQYIERLNEACAKLQSEKHVRDMDMIGSILPTVLHGENTLPQRSVLVTSKFTQGSSKEVRDPRLIKVATRSPDKNVNSAAVERIPSPNATTTSQRSRKLSKETKKMSYSEYMKLKVIEKEKKDVKGSPGDRNGNAISHLSKHVGESQIDLQKDRMPLNVSDANHTIQCASTSDYMSKFQSPQARSGSNSTFYSEFQSPIPPQNSASPNLFQSLLTPNSVAPDPPVQKNNTIPSNSSPSYSSKPRPRLEKKAFLPFPVLCDDGSVKNVFRGTVDGSLREMPSSSSTASGNREVEKSKTCVVDESPSANVKEGANKLIKVLQNVFADDKKKKLIERQLSNGKNEESVDVDHSISTKYQTFQQGKPEVSKQDDHLKSKESSGSAVSCTKKQCGKENFQTDENGGNHDSEIMKNVPNPDSVIAVTDAGKSGLEISQLEKSVPNDKASLSEKNSSNKYSDVKKSDGINKICAKSCSDSKNRDDSVKRKDLSKGHRRSETDNNKKAIDEVSKDGTSNIRSAITKHRTSHSSSVSKKSVEKHVTKKDIGSIKQHAKADVKTKTAAKESITLGKKRATFRESDKLITDEDSKMNYEKPKVSVTNKSREHEVKDVSNVDNLKADAAMNELISLNDQCAPCQSTEGGICHEETLLDCHHTESDDVRQSSLFPGDFDNYPRLFVCRSPNADIPGINFSLDLSAQTASSKSYCSPLRLIPSLCSEVEHNTTGTESETPLAETGLSPNPMEKARCDHQLEIEPLEHPSLLNSLIQKRQSTCENEPMEKSSTRVDRTDELRSVSKTLGPLESIGISPEIRHLPTIPENKLSFVEISSDIPQLVSSLAMKLSALSSSLYVPNQFNAQNKKGNAEEICIGSKIANQTPVTESDSLISTDVSHDMTELPRKHDHSKNNISEDSHEVMLSSLSSSPRMPSKLNIKDKEVKTGERCTNSKRNDQFPKANSDALMSWNASYDSTKLPQQNDHSNSNISASTESHFHSASSVHSLKTCGMTDEKVTVEVTSLTDYVQECPSASSSSSCLVIDESCGSGTYMNDPSVAEKDKKEAVTIVPAQTDREKVKDDELEADDIQCLTRSLSLKELGFNFYLQVLSDMSYQPSVMVLDFKEAMDKGCQHSTCSTCRKDLTCDVVSFINNNNTDKDYSSTDEAQDMVQGSQNIVNEITSRQKCLLEENLKIGTTSQILPVSSVVSEANEAIVTQADSFKWDNHKKGENPFSQSSDVFRNDRVDTTSADLDCLNPQRIKIKPDNKSKKEKCTTSRKCICSPVKDSWEIHNSYKATLMKRQRERNQLKKIKENLRKKGIGKLKRKPPNHESKVDSSNVEDDDELRDTLLDDLLTYSTDSTNVQEPKLRTPKETGLSKKLEVDQSEKQTESGTKIRPLDLYDMLDKDQCDFNKCKYAARPENKIVPSMVPRSMQKLLKKKETIAPKKELNSLSVENRPNSHLSSDCETMGENSVSKSCGKHTMIEKLDLVRTEKNQTSVDKCQSNNQNLTKWKLVREPEKHSDADEQSKLSNDIHINAIHLPVVQIGKSESKIHSSSGNKYVPPKENSAKMTNTSENLPSVIPCVSKGQECIIGDSADLMMSRKDDQALKELNSTNFRSNTIHDSSIPTDKGSDDPLKSDGRGMEPKKALEIPKDKKWKPVVDVCETSNSKTNEMVLLPSLSCSKKVDVSLCETNLSTVFSDCKDPQRAESYSHESVSKNISDCDQGLNTPDLSLYLNQPLGDVDYRVGFHFGQQNAGPSSTLSCLSGSSGRDVRGNSISLDAAMKVDCFGDVDYRTHNAFTPLSNSGQNYAQTVAYHSKNVCMENGSSQSEISSERKLLWWPSIEPATSNFVTCNHPTVGTDQDKQIGHKSTDGNENPNKLSTTINNTSVSDFNPAESVASCLSVNQPIVTENMKNDKTGEKVDVGNLDTAECVRISADCSESEDTFGSYQEKSLNKHVSVSSVLHMYNTQESDIGFKIELQHPCSTVANSFTDKLNSYWAKPKTECSVVNSDKAVVRIQNEYESVPQSPLIQSYMTSNDNDDVTIDSLETLSDKKPKDVHQCMDEDSNNAVENIRQCFPDILGTQKAIVEIANAYSEDEYSDEETCPTNGKENQPGQPEDIAVKIESLKQENFETQKINLSLDHVSMLKRAIDTVSHCMPKANPTSQPNIRDLEEEDLRPQNIDLSHDHISMLEKAINTVKRVIPAEKHMKKEVFETGKVNLTPGQVSMLRGAMNTLTHSIPKGKESESSHESGSEPIQSSDKECDRYTTLSEREHENKADPIPKVAEECDCIFKQLTKGSENVEESSNNFNASALLKNSKSIAPSLPCVETLQTRLNDCSSDIIDAFVNHHSKKFPPTMKENHKRETPVIKSKSNERVSSERPSSSSSDFKQFSDCSLEDLKKTKETINSPEADTSIEQKVLLSDVPMEALTQAKLHVLEQLKSLNEDDNEDLDDNVDDTITEDNIDLLSEGGVSSDNAESGELSSSSSDDAESHSVRGDDQNDLSHGLVKTKSIPYADFIKSRLDIVNISSDSDSEDLKVPRKKKRNTTKIDVRRKVIQRASFRCRTLLSEKKDADFIEIISSQSDNSTMSSPVLVRHLSSPVQELFDKRIISLEKDSPLVSNIEKMNSKDPSSRTECPKVKFQDLKICLDNSNTDTSNNSNRNVQSKSSRRVVVTSHSEDNGSKDESRLINALSELLREARDTSSEVENPERDGILKKRAKDKCRDSSPETKDGTGKFSRDLSPEMWKEGALDVRVKRSMKVNAREEPQRSPITDHGNDFRENPVYGNKVVSPEMILDTEKLKERLVKCSRNVSTEAYQNSERTGKEKKPISHQFDNDRNRSPSPDVWGERRKGKKYVHSSFDRYCNFSSQVWKNRRKGESDENSPDDRYQFCNISPDAFKNRQKVESYEDLPNGSYRNVSPDVFKNKRVKERDEFVFKERYQDSSPDVCWDQRREGRDQTPSYDRYRSSSPRGEKNKGGCKLSFDDRCVSLENCRDTNKEERDNFRQQNRSPISKGYSGRIQSSPFDSSASESSQFDNSSLPNDKRRRFISGEEKDNMMRKVVFSRPDISGDGMRTPERHDCMRGQHSSGRMDTRGHSESSSYSGSDSLSSNHKTSYSSKAEYLGHHENASKNMNRIPQERLFHRKNVRESFQSSDLVNFFSPDSDSSNNFRSSNAARKRRRIETPDYPRRSSGMRQHPLDELMEPLKKRKVPNGEEELDYYLNRNQPYRQRYHYNPNRC